MKLFKRKSNKTNEDIIDIQDEELLKKANSLVGEMTRINGVCGDIEKVTLTGVIGLSMYQGHKEVGFTTDDTFYQRVFYKPETIMNWKYFKPVT